MTATDAQVLAVKLEALHQDVGEVKSALNRLSDAITKLALVEQAQVQLGSSLERAFQAIGKIDIRLTAIEAILPKTKDTSVWVDRAITGCVVLVGGAIAKVLGVL